MGRQLRISMHITTLADDCRRLEVIQQELVREWLTHDGSTVDRLLAPEWMVTHADGRTSTSEEVLREFDSGGNRLLEGRVDEIKVRMFEGFAIVTGRTYARGEYKGHAYDVNLRFADAFVRRSGGRQCRRTLVGSRRMKRVPGPDFGTEGSPSKSV